MDFYFRQLIPAIILLSITSKVSAVNVNYTVEGTVGYSDNITRIETNPIKDSVRQVRTTWSVIDESSTSDFVLDMDVAYQDYKDDSFEDDVIANIALASNFSIVDDSFTWTLDGYYGQQAINPFAVTTPNNLQDTGFVSTGPNLILRFTSLDSLTMGYRYENFYDEITDADYSSNIYSAVLARRISALQTLSLNAVHNDLSYDNPSNADFKDYRYSLLFSSQSVTTTYTLELGIIDVEFENGADLDNDLKRFTFSRQMNTNNNISFLVSETIDNGAGAVTGTVPGFVTTDLFVSELAQLTYAHNSGDFQLTLGSLYTDQDYVVQDDLDQKIISNSIDIVYGRPITLQYGLGFQHLSRDFYNRPQVDKEDTITLSLEKSLTRNLNIEGAFVNFVRESTAQSQDIEENRIIVTLRYLGRI